MTGNEHDFAEELASARRQRDAAVARLRQLESSLSYRIGRAATRLPRALKSIRGVSVRRNKPSGGIAGSALPAKSVPTPHPVRSWTPLPRVDSPDVSVVIPVYNSVDWLEDCLSSVLAQTGPTLEVICVNDGSTDGSERILQRFAEKDERVRIVTQPNSGQSVGRNRGFAETAGRYVIYLDSDDLWQEDSLSDLVGHADSERLDLLLFDSFAFRDGDVDKSIWERYATYYQRSQEYRKVRSGIQMLADMRHQRDYRPHVGLYLARTAFVRDLGTRFIPGIVHQDNPYTFSLLLHAKRVAHVRTDFYARRIRPGSTITGLDDLRSAKGYYLSYLAMIRELGSRGLEPDTSDMVADVVHGVFQGARQKIAHLTPDEVQSLVDLDLGMDAQLVMRALRPVRARSY
ncbi:glycosyltransferase [Microbacterium sp. Leaf161]|uniref:glycosyltransferase n=1 Tax=Microbacterium sp. Leaf161 TaxID=1736281 RepID=UPI00138F8D5B|nr:glycosyltransferase [Microbacterium sp. Leaf161]